VVRPVRFSALRAAERCRGLIVVGVVFESARRIFLNSTVNLCLGRDYYRRSRFLCGGFGRGGGCRLVLCLLWGFRWVGDGIL
jgi:hypothetical protein